MSKIKELEKIYLKNNVFYEEESCQTPFLSGVIEEVLGTLSFYGKNEILICDLSKKAEKDDVILSLRKVCENKELNLIVETRFETFEEVKKYLYAGIDRVVVDISFFDEFKNQNIYEEAKKRFFSKVIKKEEDKYFYDEEEFTLKSVNLDEKNLIVNKIDFKNLKKNENGLIPVIVQECITNEVLMLAYMDEEAYEETLKTGLMTYYSRSRNEIWLKGKTSLHYQYLKELKIDCDSDTLLAKVKQLGVACHTGEKSCFFTNIYKKKEEILKNENILNVLEALEKTIKLRKESPKDGSYTTYLFKEGLDKILKKCGEEATEIIIAAKNQEKEEIKYEIADFLYHILVLMVLKEVSVCDIMEELKNR